MRTLPARRFFFLLCLALSRPCGPAFAHVFPFTSCRLQVLFFIWTCFADAFRRYSSRGCFSSRDRATWQCNPLAVRQSYERRGHIFRFHRKELAVNIALVRPLSKCPMQSFSTETAALHLLDLSVHLPSASYETKKKSVTHLDRPRLFSLNEYMHPRRGLIISE